MSIMIILIVLCAKVSIMIILIVLCAKVSIMIILSHGYYTSHRKTAAQNEVAIS